MDANSFKALMTADKPPKPQVNLAVASVLGKLSEEGKLITPHQLRKIMYYYKTQRSKAGGEWPSKFV